MIRVSSVWPVNLPHLSRVTGLPCPSPQTRGGHEGSLSEEVNVPRPQHLLGRAVSGVLMERIPTRLARFPVSVDSPWASPWGHCADVTESPVLIAITSLFSRAHNTTSKCHHVSHRQKTRYNVLCGKSRLKSSFLKGTSPFGFQFILSSEIIGNYFLFFYPLEDSI